MNIDFRRTRYMLLKRMEKKTGMICKWVGGHIHGFDHDLQMWVRLGG